MHTQNLDLYGGSERQVEAASAFSTVRFITRERLAPPRRLSRGATIYKMTIIVAAVDRAPIITEETHVSLLAKRALAPPWMDMPRSTPAWPMPSTSGRLHRRSTLDEAPAFAATAHARVTIAPEAH